MDSILYQGSYQPLKLWKITLFTMIIRKKVKTGYSQHNDINSKLSLLYNLYNEIEIKFKY